MSLNVSNEIDEQHELFETIEQVLSGLGWQHDRDGYDAIQCIAPTRWGEMGCLFASRVEPAAIHFSLTLDVKPQATKRTIINELVMMMNERLWLGHFDYWLDDEVIIFRHAIPMEGRMSLGVGELNALLTAAIEAVERFVPAFNFVIWAGKSPADAIVASMFETEGEA